MKKCSNVGKNIAAACVLSLFILNSNIKANAEDLPLLTLNEVKKAETAYLNAEHPTYNLTLITEETTVPEGAVTVKIGDNSYYYELAETDNSVVLKNLASTGAIALKTTDEANALYKVGDVYYTYDTDKLPISGYSLTEVAKSNENTITYYQKDENNTLTPK